MPVDKGSDGGKKDRRNRRRTTPTGDFQRDNSLQDAIARYQIENNYRNQPATYSKALEEYLQYTRAQPMSPSVRRANARNVRDNRAGGLKMKKEPQTTIKGKKKNKDTGGVSIPNNAGGAGQYDPWAGLPSVGDVQSDSLGILDNLVQGMLFNDGPSYDFESSMQNAAAGIRKAYAADIAAIRSNRKAERKETKRARNEVEQMYKGLAQAYGKDAIAADAAGDASVAEIQNITNQASQNLQNAQSQMIQERAALAKGLGVGEALADPAINNIDTTQQGLNRLQEFQASAATQEQRMAEANEQFFERGQAASRMEGTQKSLELLSRFLDFKRQSRDQIAQLKGQRARDVASSNASIAQQAAELQAEADAETWSRLMEYMGMRSDLEQANFDNSLAANEQAFDQRLSRAELGLDRRKFRHNVRQDQFDNELETEKARTDRWRTRQGVATDRARLELDQQKFAADQAGVSGSNNSAIPKQYQQPAQIISSSLPRASAQKVMSILSGLQQSPVWAQQTVRMNKQDVKLTGYMAANLAAQEGRRRGLSPEEINVLRMAAAASVG